MRKFPRSIMATAGWVGLAASVLTRPALGQPTSTTSISLQAKLEGVAGPTANLTVKFFDALTGGSQVGLTITLSAVPVQGGIVSVPVSPVDTSIFNGQTRYMGISVNGGEELSPRTLVTSVPYAIQAVSLASPDIAVAGSSIPSIPTYCVRTYEDPSLHPEMIPNFGSTGRPARMYRAIGSAWERAVGLGFYVGQDIASPAIWMYNSPGNRFEVNAVTFGTQPIYESTTMFTVRNNGLVSCPSLRVDGNPGLTGPALNVVGTTQTQVLTITGADVAEPFNVVQSNTVPEPQPGMVVSIDPANPGKLLVCSTPYDTKVAGAISGAGGLSVGVVMGKDNPDPLIKGDHPVAMSGRVYVWCDASSAAIEPGDMLTTSSTPGHAMKAVVQSKSFGAVIGKSMTRLKEGKGLVLVLVNLQ